MRSPGVAWGVDPVTITNDHWSHFCGPVAHALNARRRHTLCTLTAVAIVSPDLWRHWPPSLPSPAATDTCRDHCRCAAADIAVAVVTCEAEGRGGGRGGREDETGAEGGGVQSGRV